MTKLKEFFNEELKDNRIFTAEDVGEMPLNEFRDNEKAIFYQMANLGIPRRSQLAGNDDVIYVHAYTRADGTQVKAHYRSKHGHLTGAAAGTNNQTYSTSPLLKGRIEYNDIQYSPFNNKDFDHNKDVLTPESFDDSRESLKNHLKIINNVANLKYKDARDLMNLSLSDNYELNDTADYSIVDITKNPEFKQQIFDKYNINLPDDHNLCFIFNENSHLLNSLYSSPEFISGLLNKDNYNAQGNYIDIVLNNDENLFRALHEFSIYNPKIDEEGNFTGLLYDLYDFDWEKRGKLYKQGHYARPTIKAANNAAYTLQKSGIIKPYYVLAPIKFKLPFNMQQNNYSTNNLGE